MAWNPSPKVAAARDFANKFNQEIVIILHVTKEGQIGYASYGKTKPLCTAAKNLADQAFDALTSDPDTSPVPVKMAYTATDPRTNRCYAICSADPSHLADAIKEIKQWVRDGAVIELLPTEQAKERFCTNVPEPQEQQSMFAS